MNRATTYATVLTLISFFLLLWGLTLGSADIPISEIASVIGGKGSPTAQFIVLETRLPALLTAMLAGASLSVSGLLMQTCFANPLAGPSIMGISSGSSLGVALVMMLGASYVGLWGNIAIVTGAFAGAMVVLVILLLFSSIVKSSEVLLILGILIGYLTSSAISLLNYFAPEKAVHNFVIWGMGNFSSVHLSILPWFAALSVILMGLAMLYIRSLNVLLFGMEYARSAGIRPGRVRNGLMTISGALTAVVTAWCGPIGFLGLVIPHIARMLLSTSNHRVVLPITILTGAATGILCQVISVLPSCRIPGSIPINAITPIIGVPVIIYVMLNRRRLLYFN